MGRTSQKAKLRNQIIQREQWQLLRIQKEVRTILGNINETINALKVEELQLKSAEVEAMKIRNDKRKKQREASTSVSLRVDGEEPCTSRSANPALLQNNEMEETLVNKQEIELDLFVKPFLSYMEEEEDEEWH